MKIGLVHDYQPNLGGTTEVVIRMSRELSRRGHEVKLITHPTSWIRKFDEKYLDIVPAERVRITFMEYIPYTFTRTAKIISLFKSGRIQLAHAHYALPFGVSAYLAKQAYGIPYIVTLHGTDVLKLAKIPSLKPVMKLCLENADAVTTVSEYLKKQVMRRLDISREIKVIPNFVNPERFRVKRGCGFLRRVFDIPRDNFVITHISNFAKIKNTLIIPDIARLVLKEHPNVTFLMVGEALCERGYDLEELKEKVKKEGLEKHFRFTGRRKDIARILNISDVFLMTSQNEAFGLSILEALAVSVPVVVPKVGGIPEFVRNNRNGFLVKKQNIEAYAERINRLLDDSNLRRRLGANAKKTVEERYTSDIVIPQYEGVYRSIIE